MSNEVTTQNTALVPMNENLSLSNAHHTEYLAKDLAKFIRDNKLFNNIQGKEYVNVEGWQYAGTRLGILPVVDDSRRLAPTDELAKEIKYECRVKLVHLITGNTVGFGTAICSNSESTKKYYQEYAIASMAQTRAIGKAYRNMLAWIIRAAGYQPTPAEEMDQVVELSDAEKKLNAICELLQVASREYYNKVVKKHIGAYKEDPDFLKAAEYTALKFPKPVESVP